MSWHKFFFFHSREFSAVKTQSDRASASTSSDGQPGTETQADDADATVPMMSQNHFIDAKVLDFYRFVSSMYAMNKEGTEIKVFKTNIKTAK